MFDHGVEIAITMKKWYIVFDAPSADDKICGCTDCDPLGAQMTIVRRGFDRNSIVQHGYWSITGQCILQLFGMQIVSRAL